MSQTNRLYDEIARLMTNAAGMAQGVRREAETAIKSQLERLIADMDVVTREEFEAVREMAILAREENEKLAARLAALEGAAGAKSAPAKASGAARTAAKDAGAKEDAPKASSRSARTKAGPGI